MTYFRRTGLETFPNSWTWTWTWWWWDRSGDLSFVICSFCCQV